MTTYVAEIRLLRAEDHYWTVCVPLSGDVSAAARQAELFCLGYTSGSGYPAQVTALLKSFERSGQYIAEEAQAKSQYVDMTRDKGPGR